MKWHQSIARSITRGKKRDRTYENMPGVDSSSRLEFGVAGFTRFVILAARTFAFGGLITTALARLFRGLVFACHYRQYKAEMLV